MRRLLAVLAVTLVCASMQAQRPPRRPGMATPGVNAAEAAVRQAIERLGNDKKAIDRDLEVLARIRASDRVLIDPMQPTIAVQKAFEEMVEAERLNQDFLLRQGLIRSRQELDAARNSPGTADFARLRALIRDQALGPSSRLVVRTATRLQEETMAWITVQELMTAHLKMLSEITGESLRAAQEE
jgi:hypothetical protein